VLQGRNRSHAIYKKARVNYRAGPAIQKRYVRARSRITSQNSRSDLGWICLIRLSKTTGIAGYFEDFANENLAKTAAKMLSYF